MTPSPQASGQAAPSAGPSSTMPALALLLVLLAADLSPRPAVGASLPEVGRLDLGFPVLAVDVAGRYAYAAAGDKAQLEKYETGVSNSPGITVGTLFSRSEAT